MSGDETCLNPGIETDERASIFIFFNILLETFHFGSTFTTTPGGVFEKHRLSTASTAPRASYQAV